MQKKVVLTGVKPTGQPHLGNYVGAMRPSLEMAKSEEFDSFLFIADYHSLTAVHDAKVLDTMIYEVAASWLACGLDPERTVIYRQSDVPEVFELHWILSCFTAKGLMNRAHAYKAKIQENQEFGKEDLDFGVNIGLYTYPVLMAADILLFQADFVPVGEDQVQHVEIARDIAQKFNKTYKVEALKIPKAKLTESKLVVGLDGRKMSKSYENSIPLFCDSAPLRKLVMKIKTDSLPPEAPKDPSTSLIFDLFKEFASPAEIESLKADYAKGIGWGVAKEALYQILEREIAPMRSKYQEYLTDRNKVDALLSQGALIARERANHLLTTLRKTVGLRR